MQKIEELHSVVFAIIVGYTSIVALMIMLRLLLNHLFATKLKNLKNKNKNGKNKQTFFG